MDGRNMHLAAEQGGDEAGLFHLGPDAVHIGPDAGEALEIGLDVGPGLAVVDAELGRQTKG